MSTTPVVPAPTGTGSPPVPDRASLPAARLLVLWAGLMLLLPSELVLPQIGSAGSPANLLGVGFLLWWVCAKLAGRVEAPINPMHVALAILVVVVLISFANGMVHGWTRPVDIRQPADAVYTFTPVSQAELFDKSMLGGMRGLITIGSWVGVALMVMDGLRSWREIDRLVSWVVWMSAVVAAIGIYQYFTGDNLARFIRVPGLSATYEIGTSISRSVLNRVSSTTTHPIEFCVVLTTIFPLAMHRALHPHAVGTLNKIVACYVPAGLIGLAIPMAVSRSGIVALAVVMIVLFSGWPNNRRIWVVVLAPPTAILMRSALPGLLGTIKALFSQGTSDPSVTARTADYGAVLEIYSAQPWFGRGAFTFIPQYYRALDNQILLNLVELGAIGLAASIWIFAVGYYLARYAKRHALSIERSHFGLALSAGILAMLITYVTFDAWGFAKAGAVTFFLLGLAGAARKLAHTPDDTRPAT
ncbi:O-antigen ligase family protein [Nocardioides currus]|uniref:O-antigen ligase-related domain-containing protein n=1 Tax=Nocardioides currus TaxID=2133958 RepID=A0A2R7Z148_9ACTN|nr:O-antigen ligase family protein [Nocardioides currus]PUA82345.1 hypothetical protein C7S10_00905 [Nocardioides currus]